MQNTLPVETDRWWDADLPSLRERIRAFNKAFFTLGIEQELRSTLAVEPTHRHELADQPDSIEVDVYKLWYVLHHGRSGDDRKTLLRKKQIGHERTTVAHIRETGVETSLLPLDPGWPTDEPTPDAVQEAGRDA